MMANYPRRPEKLPDPGQKHNAQGDHAGVAHRPEEFDVMNPENCKRDADPLLPFLT